MATHVEHRYQDGSAYNGYVDREGHREGFGILILGDGARFRGHFSSGLFSGLGVITFPDGSKCSQALGANDNVRAATQRLAGIP
ncbi:MORN repeat-containing protein 4 [Elysia marginata]|uniref:MORN repeat-containing protein 4 n=1 Tax=Elysia marginata TaxID=1093978 RepID=A0AAV4JPZ5_9GAST|nr:MORN repeat-containing protein 4 [Elysia marginata]